MTESRRTPARPGARPARPRMRRAALVLLAALAGLTAPGLVLHFARAQDHAAPAHEGDHAAPGHEAGHEGGHEGGGTHLPTFITLLQASNGDSPVVRFLVKWENTVFSWGAVLILGLFFGLATRRLAAVPGRLQSLAEMAVEWLDGLVGGLMGPAGRRYVPFLGTLFLYILVMNVMGLVPLLKSPTSSLDMTAGLAACVFLYVQYTGLRNLGLVGYLDHLAGNPRGAIGWCLVPLMLPLHVIGELAKPMTLALRLFGNVTGEDILIAAFVALGSMAVAAAHLPIGIPFQAPLLFLTLLFSTIQALVFTLLSAVYFLMMQPHHEEEGAH